MVQDATYTWFGPNGFSATTHDPVINNITAAAAGLYYVEVVMSDGCATLVSTNTTVFVQATPAPAIIPTIAPVCEGNSLTISANTIGVPPGADVSYEWSSVQSATSIGTTTTPVFNFNNISASSTGDYYVVVTVNGCVAPASDIQNIQVVPTSEVPFAGMDMNECGFGNVVLSATTPTVGTGVWTSPTGAVIQDANNPQAEALGLSDGTNVFVWNLSNGICENYATDTLVVNYNLVEDEAAAGDDIGVCDATSTTLNALAPSSAFGVWSQPAGQNATISNTTSTTPTVTGLIPGNTYTFTYTLSQGTCLNYDSDVVEVMVSELPATLAHITEDRKYTCGDDETTLDAVAPNLGEGNWTTPSTASIVTSNNASTIVTDIPMGATMYVWTLTNGACENYDADSIVIYREDAIEVTDDNFTINLNERIEGGDVMVNDVVGNVNDWEITIVEEPTMGEIEMTDGIFNYVPFQNAFGTETIVYEILSLIHI